MALQPWRKGIVTRIESATYNTRRFWIQVPELTMFDFKPGQFVTLDLPIHEKPAKRLRSYSIASWPDDSNTFELLIVWLESGAGTNYLFNDIKEGSELVFRGPVGVFTLPDTLEKELYFICTGTGIAPFRSMVQHLHRHKIAHPNIYLIFGTRTKNDLLYQDELKGLEAGMDGFHFLPTLSREQWEGQHGYVHGVYENLIVEKKNTIGELPPASFYLCGWKAMIDEAKQRIQALGYDRKAIHQELYG